MSTRHLVRLAAEGIASFVIGLGAVVLFYRGVARESVWLVVLAGAASPVGLALGLRGLMMKWMPMERCRVGMAWAAAGSALCAYVLLGAMWVVTCFTLDRAATLRDRTRRTQSVLARALHAYADEYGRFPPGGEVPIEGTLPMDSLRASKEAARILREVDPSFLRHGWVADGFDGLMRYVSDDEGREAMLVSSGPDMSFTTTKDNIVLRLRILNWRLPDRLGLVLLPGAVVGIAVVAVVLRKRRGSRRCERR